MVKRASSMPERNVHKSTGQNRVNQLVREVEVSMRNQAIIDSFLLEHPDLDEKAVKTALNKLSSLYPGNSSQSKA